MRKEGGPEPSMPAAAGEDGFISPTGGCLAKDILGDRESLMINPGNTH
jgi:hypothetical protein